MCRFRIQKRVERKYRKEHFIFNLFPKGIFNCLLLSVIKTYFTYLIEFETKLTWSRYCHANVIFQWKHLNSSFNCRIQYTILFVKLFCRKLYALYHNFIDLHIIYILQITTVMFFVSLLHIVFEDHLRDMNYLDMPMSYYLKLCVISTIRCGLSKPCI